MTLAIELANQRDLVRTNSTYHAIEHYSIDRITESQGLLADVGGRLG